MPPASPSPIPDEAYDSDDAASTREKARTLVKMADMVTRSTEKVERKAESNDYDESGLDLNLLAEGDEEGGGADSTDNDDAAKAKDAKENKGNDEKDTSAIAVDDDDDDDNEHEYDSSDGDASSAANSRISKASAAPSRRKSSSSAAKKDSKGGASSPTADASTGDLSLGLGGGGDNSVESLREQLTQTRRALLQVRENAKLKHRKLELEHTTIKKELKKAKDVIEKQTIEYKKLKVKLEGIEKERDDAREELSRELGGRGSLVSNISQENGRMIRRLRDVRAERDKLVQERDELKQSLELCTCDAGKDHDFTLTSSLDHEKVPMNKASALSQHFSATGSSRNIFTSTRSIAANLEGELDATKQGISSSWSAPRRGRRSYHTSTGEERKVTHADDDDDQSVMSFASMAHSVRSLPVYTRKAVDRAFSSTSMRLNNELDGPLGPGGSLTVEFKRKKRGKRSYHRSSETSGNDGTKENNIAPIREVDPTTGTTESSDSGKSFWACTSQRFLMGMAQEI